MRFKWKVKDYSREYFKRANICNKSKSLQEKLNTHVKIFIELTVGACTIKVFTAGIYGFSY